MTSDSPVAIIYDASGNAANIFPAGFIRVTDEPRQVFYDPFDPPLLDTTNRWVAPTSSGGGVAASVSGGVLTIGSGTTASGYSYLQSVPNFAPSVPAWIGFSYAISIETPVQNNANRFWGCGSSPGTPTTAIPITDGAGFEIDTAGKLYAVVYAGGTRTQIADLSSSGNNTQPADAAYHRYILYYRTDKMYWFIDVLTTPVATSNFQVPNVQTLPAKIAATASSSAPAGSRVISCNGAAVWDTGKNNTQLSDGTYPWRKVTIDKVGNLQTKQISTTPTTSTVAALATTTTLLASNTLRLGATIYNDSTSILYLKLGATASNTSYTVQLFSNGYYEVPYGYTGIIDGIWVSATGNARVTEIV
jgi:hypothetical protein